jgi:hypothetical protein
VVQRMGFFFPFLRFSCPLTSQALSFHEVLSGPIATVSPPPLHHMTDKTPADPQPAAAVMRAAGNRRQKRGHGAGFGALVQRLETNHRCGHPWWAPVATSRISKLNP